jgi:hypothetical protein
MAEKNNGEYCLDILRKFQVPFPRVSNDNLSIEMVKEIDSIILSLMRVKDALEVNIEVKPLINTK